MLDEAFGFSEFIPLEAREYPNENSTGGDVQIKAGFALDTKI